MNLYAGIDISKDKLDISILDGENQPVLNNKIFANTEKGIHQLLKLFGDYGLDQLWICMEHTGAYGYLLICKLAAAEATFSVINPLEIKRSMGITRGKNDAVDALRIASYGVRFRDKLVPYTAAPEAITQLKSKLTIRDFFVKRSVQGQNCLKSLEVQAKVMNVRAEVKKIKKSIKQDKAMIKQLEKDMLEILGEAPELKKTYDKITQVSGVGMITAFTCIALTENFTRFSSARKFCCYAGLAPFDYQSGSSIKAPKRTSKLRNRTLKSLLLNAGMTAAKYDMQLSAYKRRKLEQNKHKMVVNNAVAAKLVLRIFAVANRDEPWVKLAA